MRRKRTKKDVLKRGVLLALCLSTPLSCAYASRKAVYGYTVAADNQQVTSSVFTADADNTAAATATDLSAVAFGVYNPQYTGFTITSSDAVTITATATGGAASSTAYANAYGINNNNSTTTIGGDASITSTATATGGTSSSTVYADAYGINNIDSTTIIEGDTSITTTATGGSTSSSSAYAYATAYGINNTDSTTTIGGNANITATATGGSASSTSESAAAFAGAGGIENTNSATTIIEGDASITATASGGSASLSTSYSLIAAGASAYAYGINNTDSTTTIGGNASITATATGGAASSTAYANAYAIAYGINNTDSTTTIGGNASITATASGGSASSSSAFAGASAIATGIGNYTNSTTTINGNTSIIATATGGTGTGAMVSADAIAIGIDAQAQSTITLNGDVSIVTSATAGTANGVTGTAITGSLYAYDGKISINTSGTHTVQLTGDIVSVYGADVDVTLSNSTSYLIGSITTASATTDLTIANDAVWTDTGTSSVSSLTMNNGLVAFTKPSDSSSSSGYYSLTADSLSGSGGLFSLYSNLGAGYTDELVVNGNTSGTYSLNITNTGTTPTDRYETYKVVDLTSSATNTASFSSNALDFGAYEYKLASGTAISSLSSSYEGVNDTADYYLYNTFAPSSVSKGAIGLSAGTGVVWYGEMNEIKKRLGDLRLGTASSNDFWVRSYADKYNMSPGGVSYNQIQHGVELGKDKLLAFPGGKRYLGFVVGATTADSTYSGGKGTSKSDYIGLYDSWMKDNGTYFDLIGKYNWLHHNFDTSSDHGAYDNQGMGISLETGKRNEKSHGIYIQPEAEFSAFWAKDASYVTNRGLVVNTPESSSVQLRLGCSVGKHWQDSDGTKREVYGKLSVVNEFAGSNTVEVDGVDFDSSLNGRQLVTGIGYVQDGKSYQAYIDLEKSWGSTTSKIWGGNVGYRWKF